jgi:hypothetical protein
MINFVSSFVSKEAGKWRSGLTAARKALLKKKAKTALS